MISTVLSIYVVIAFMVKSAILNYLTLLQITTMPSRVNTDPEVDFLESFSPWKSESVYPGIFRSSLEYTSI